MTRTEIDPFVPDDSKEEQSEEQLIEPVRPQKRRRKKSVSKLIMYLLIIFVILAIVFGVNVINSGENLAKTLGNVGLWGQIKHLISSDDKKLQGEEEDRINVLLLGMGGLGHDGPYLTDTIIIASFRPSTKQVAMISIPRDLLVPVPGFGWRKINHANHYGEMENPGLGAETAVKVISETFEIPIHYYVRIDFSGFKKIIDDLGEIKVEVENTLNDEHYPIPGKETATTTERYEHLYVEKGTQSMDGELALKYVRSRQAKGVEGSDFARSRRQQKVLMAVKEKILSFSTLVNPIKISNLMDSVSQHLSTNFKVYEIIRMFNLGRDVDMENITRRVFDDSPDGLLYSMITEEGAFVLQPKAGDFSEMKLAIKHVFDPQKIEEIKPKRVEIQNGTKINGLAYKTSQYLQSLDYKVIEIGNAPTQDYQKTVIYNLKNGSNNEVVGQLAELLGAEIAKAVPEWALSTTSPKVNSHTDVLIILGQDRKDL